MRATRAKKICIICEGYEELEYIVALKNKAVFSYKYEFITVNSKSINTRLTSQSKHINAKYIEEYTGIKGYDATTEQRKELFSKIKKSNYEIMKENVKKLSTNDEDTSSTNILKFIKHFESDDESWIEEINNKLYEGE